MTVGVEAVLGVKGSPAVAFSVIAALRLPNSLQYGMGLRVRRVNGCEIVQKQDLRHRCIYLRTSSRGAFRSERVPSSTSVLPRPVSWASSRARGCQ